MKFKELLAHYRERSHVTKTGLAERLGLSPTYTMEIESGRKPAPTIDRCRDIARALSLSREETQQLIDAAMEERLTEEALIWLSEREKKYSKIDCCSKEVLEALSDPVAVKALLATYKSKEDVKAVVQNVIENLNHLSKERRLEMLRHCK